MEVIDRLHAQAALLQERAPHNHWIGGFVGIRTGLDAVLKRKISSPRREWDPDHPIVQPVAVLTELSLLSVSNDLLNLISLLVKDFFYKISLSVYKKAMCLKLDVSVLGVL
jgi:hypothetical protein